MKPPLQLRDGPVLTITLAEPDKRNPLNEGVRTALDRIAADLESSADVRVVRLRGQGPSFSAGADFRSQTQAQRRETWRASRAFFGGWQRTLERIERLPQITVAELHGAVYGGAVLLAASCDLRIAAADSRFCIPELRLGIPLTWAGSPRLMREIGIARARDMVMTGRVVDATEAHAWGLVTRLAGESDLSERTDRLVAELLSMPEAPLAITKDQFAALSRNALGASGWADADLGFHARHESESKAARADYVERVKRKDTPLGGDGSGQS